MFLLLALMLAVPAMAQRTGIKGIVVDSKTGVPVQGATVMLDGQGASATSTLDGSFVITDATAGSDVVLVFSYGYKDWSQDVVIESNRIVDVGTIRQRRICSHRIAN